MTFQQAVDELRRSGARIRRKKWPRWRQLYVSRKSSELPRTAIVETLETKHPTATLSDGSPDYLLRWGLRRWRPLLLDLIADDWEVA